MLPLNDRLAISALVVSSICLIILVTALALVVHVVNGVTDKVNSLTNAANVALMVTSAARGVTEGLGEAIGSIKCRKYQQEAETVAA